MDRRRLLALLAAGSPAAAARPRGRGRRRRRSPAATSYIPINTLTGTTIQAGGRRGVLTVDCGLRLADPKLRDYAELSLPRLRAAYVQVVQIYAAGLPSGRRPNADFIAADLQRQTDLILGKPGARLLLGAVMVN